MANAYENQTTDAENSGAKLSENQGSPMIAAKLQPGAGGADVPEKTEGTK